ncbi:HD domain-containing phosphohydrolase [Deinococcus sp. QL22]|uniref:HD domain-containing phosphohydrolase n=1 Tax=Deinococcus sp. QL22 TaxID=2939437 RepID=UPI00201737C6|nr:HD domain-containing phosphohydrolase [Deinococcus sp. QL22]UQN09794.1 HD domain-containing protein [Deinococcus sp. QL22]
MTPLPIRLHDPLASQRQKELRNLTFLAHSEIDAIRRQRHQELEALTQIALALRDAPSAQAITASLAGMTHRLLNASGVVYLAYDSETDTLSSQAVLGMSEELGAVVLPRGQGLSWAAIESQDVLYISDVMNDLRVYRPGFLDSGAMLIAPLIGRTQVYGVLVTVRDAPFDEDDAHLARTFAAHTVTALDREAHIQALEEARSGTLLALGLTLEARDLDTHGHTERVAELSDNLAQALGLNPVERIILREGAYLHDIGKLQIPDAILLKPGSLTAQEWTLMQEHVVRGEALARKIPGVAPGALRVVRSHHERWDGSGYPDALVGEAIPLLARLFAICDVFDALTNERPYKTVWTVEAALHEIQNQSGRHFDPVMVGVFLRMRPNALQPSQLW